MDPESLDLVIVGAGPCGLAAAVAAKEAGLGYEILDRGCITGSLLGYPYYMTFFSTAERLEIGGVPFTIPDPKPTRRDALAYYRRVVGHHRLPVRQYEEVTKITGGQGAFTVHTRKGERTADLSAAAVVIATGGFGQPNYLNVPGEELEKVLHYYREPYPFFDQDVVIVGGGNSAAESALDLHRNGVRVRMVHFAHTLDRGVKPWVRPDLENRIEAGDIIMHWGCRLTAIAPATVTVTEVESGVATELPNDWVLAMTGWNPDRSLLTGLGATVDPDTGIPAHDPDTMETDVPGVYIAGVIAAGYDANRIFIENGREHGARIVAHTLARQGS